MHIRTILTDNGKEFTERLLGLRKQVESGRHEFDRLCAQLGIELPPNSTKITSN